MSSPPPLGSGELFSLEILATIGNWLTRHGHGQLQPRSPREVKRLPHSLPLRRATESITCDQQMAPGRPPPLASRCHHLSHSIYTRWAGGVRLQSSAWSPHGCARTEAPEMLSCLSGAMLEARAWPRLTSVSPGGFLTEFSVVRRDSCRQNSDRPGRRHTRWACTQPCSGRMNRKVSWRRPPPSGTVWDV